MRQTLFLDLERQMLVGGLNDPSPAKLPDLKQNDALILVLQGVEKQASTAVSYYRPVPIDFSRIKAAISSGADVPPTGGTICMGLVGGVPDDVTPPFAPGVAKPALETMLNALPGVIAKGGVKVLATNTAPNIFRVRWIDAAQTALFEFRHNLLEPLSDEISTVLTQPGGQIQALKYRALPLCFTDQFALPVAPIINAAVVRPGNGTRNCIQAVGVPRAAAGSVSFSFASFATRILSVASLNASTLAGALNAIYDDGAVRFAVTANTLAASTVYSVECVGPLALQDQTLLTVQMYDQAPLQTPTARLPLNGPSLELAFDGAAKLQQIFELEITDGNGDVGTPIQTPVTLINDIIDDSMSIGSDPNWVVPSGPDYPPYDPAGAMIVAARAYVSPLGQGTPIGTAGKSFVVTHHLGTQNCLVDVRETGGTHRRLPDDTYSLIYLNDDQIQVDFAGAPTDGQYEIMIVVALPSDLALPHHTHPISDILGLQDLLNSLSAGTNPLDLWPSIPESKLPRHIAWRNADGTLRFDVLPVELLPPGTPYIGPDGGWYVTLPGPPPITVQLLDPTGHLPVGTLPLDPSSWPGLVTALAAALAAGAAAPPGYIPIKLPGIDNALYPASAPLRPDAASVLQTLTRALPGFADGGNVSGALPHPAQGAGKVYAVVGAASAAAVRYRAPQHFADGTRLGSDGAQWFPVVVAAGDNVAYPAEMERELFRVHVSANMLARNCRFSINGQLSLGLSGPAADLTSGQYTLRLSFGRPVGPVLSGVVWGSDPISERLIVGDAGVTHAFGLSVTRARDADTLTAAASFYNRTNTIAPPASGDFIVRGVLTRWDLEDVAAVQGQVNLSLKGTAAVVDLTQLSAS